MIEIFKRFNPRYQRIIRGYAKRVWRNERTSKLDQFVLKRIKEFRDKYQRALEIHYLGDPKYKKYNERTIKRVADQWLVDQKGLLDNINVVAETKKQKIKDALIKQLKKVDDSELSKEDKLDPAKRTREVQDQIDALYLDPEDRETKTIHRVYSFEKNLKKRINQMAEQAGFDLGTEINMEVSREIFTVFRWVTQGDDRVRCTHRKLNGKIFRWNDPPTTIDKYGNKHTGPPGTEPGCRCHAEIAKGKPLRNYVAKCTQKK